jgi:PAS domain S-box-containing protein
MLGMKKREQDHFFNVILDSVADGVFTINEKGEITFFNRAAEEITRFTREEALGHNCFDIFRANICQTNCALKETIKTGKEIINLPINIINKDGKELPVSVSTAVLRDEKGKIIGGVETFRDLSAIEELRKELRKQYSFQDIVSKNHTIQEIFQILPDVAESDSTVLIQGSSGSGKELFAKAIHNLSLRKDKPFVKVNCGALPDNLLESELFGYVKGAFTDAKRDKPGRFALADGGTIFLDEIGDMSPALQVKLLRVLQDGEYEPLGGTGTSRVDVRVVAATNKDLSTLVRSRQFRDDLYYRLNVVKIDLPSLSRRREDIPLLVEHFVEKFNLKTGKNISGVSHEVMRFLMRYEYPGNIRELENIIEHAFVMCKGEVLELRHLPSELIESSKETLLKEKEVSKPLQTAEAEAILRALERNKGNRLRTARELGIDRTTLWRKIKRYGIVS